MSIAALTTLAAARVERAPMKLDVGKQTPKAQDDLATITDILITQVPTEVVAPYTAVTAAIVGAVGKVTAANPHPDQLVIWRWLAFGILIALTVGLVWEGKGRKSNNWGFPYLAVAGAVVAAVGWSFALPGSPLIPYIHGHNSDILTPIFVAFAATGAATLLAGAQTRKSP